ncbi:class I poly(R)-hydroxyalkanoic acid synthase [Mameliella alba]|nr:class I poly(R)-hydroxyalkanoic acid synthase [Antarctobacter heliothermus]MBY6146505.1 class I poly(R)-hydroxyalkanoic acid synthase [Mameliella alba]MBY6162734.1 class I poly(R)-hydroxyalkanoic acid synthase [Mameliella alba]MBY6170997.1 class I poly(R)-hydroxyalkanoic acid synthase [Mameliella alba]MBY6176221.1 class I poly(R)-hydroxyalkanoic acid synthase [Mameliella alba]
MSENAPSITELAQRQRETAEKLQALTARLITAVSRRKTPNPAIDAPGPDLYLKTAAAWWSNVLSNPTRAMEKQAEFWQESMKAYADALHTKQDGETDSSSDKRFAGEDWAANPWFNYLMRQYQVTSGAIRDAVEHLDTLPDKEKRRLRYFSDQIVNLMAPNNFLGSNPEALRRALETEGASLLQGLENLVSDLEANDGDLLVKLVDDGAFEVGGNLATSPGKVVLRTKMMELIQYAPATDEVHEIPLLIFPPWINKFYILDMKPQNSMIRWLTDQGFTVFVASWVNPDAEYADVGLEDYIKDGYLSAIETVKKISKQDKINVVGYCIAGTTLAMTLSYLKKKGDASVNSATFFTALTDFSEQGEFTPFLQDDFIDGIEIEVKRHGLLPARVMSRTMSFLRSNDLVYGPAIRSYMMGQTPPAFDLLFWNGDSTNLPGKMTMQYLRGLCQRNEFAEGRFELMGETLSVEDVEIPLMAVTAQTDHIAAWKDCYRGVRKMGSENKTFIVSESGHIAGIVNPPSKKKYGHYTNTNLQADADTWLEAADFHEGSWWPRWKDWLAERSGGMVPGRVPGKDGGKDLGAAPGTYVKVKAR